MAVAIELRAGRLEQPSFAFDGRQKLSDEVPRANDPRTVTPLQVIGEGRFSGADGPRQ